jgi:phytoene synthase
MEYVYGAAEVMGLYMSNILNLPKEAHPYARYLGRSMQCINALRDIQEDNTLGRSYIPLEDLQEYNLTNLNYDYVKHHPQAFADLINTHITRFCYWLQTAEQGYHYLPKRYLISVKTAMDMYQWTAEQIHKNPLIVYDWKVKPLISQIIATVFANIINPETSDKRNLLYNCEPSTLPQTIRSL